MKQNFIIWIASAFITFVFVYIQNITSPEHPINGKVNFAGGQVLYSLDKVYRSEKGYTVFIKSNVKNMKANLEWKEADSNSQWNSTPLNIFGKNLSAVIPPHPPLSIIKYKIILSADGKIVSLPQVGSFNIKFLGKVPSQISMLYFITLFSGILLAIRTGLEVFRNKPRLKMYTIFTVIAFFSFTLIFSTVKKGCEFGIIGKTRIVPISDLFPSGAVLLLLLWIVAMILIFNLKRKKIFAVTASIVTILIFVLGRF